MNKDYPILFMCTCFMRMFYAINSHKHIISYISGAGTEFCSGGDKNPPPKLLIKLKRILMIRVGEGKTRISKYMRTNMSTNIRMCFSIYT